MSFKLINGDNILEMKVLIFLVGLVVVSGCMPPIEEKITEVKLDFRSKKFQDAYQVLMDKDLDSFKRFSIVSDPNYRYLLAKDISVNIDNTELTDSIITYLSDSNFDVRAKAAFNLGQRDVDSKVLVNAFRNKDTIDVDNYFNRNLLLSIGKIGSLKNLNQLVSVKTYRDTDTLLQEGRAKAIFYFARRGLYSVNSVNLCVDQLEDNGVLKVNKLYYLQSLLRLKDIDLSLYIERLKVLLQKENDTEIRVGLISLIARNKDVDSNNFLKDLLLSAKSWREKWAILKGLKGYSYIRNAELVLSLLEDENEYIASQAADFFISDGNQYDVSLYKSKAEKVKSTHVRNSLYKSYFTHTPYYFKNSKSKVADDVWKIIEAERSEYRRAELLDAVGQDLYQVPELKERYTEVESSIEKITIVQLLINALKSPNFINTWKGRSRSLRNEILSFLVAEMKEGDSGVLAVCSGEMKDLSEELKLLKQEPGWLDSILMNLELPRQIEPYNELVSFANHTYSGNRQKAESNFDHRIAWDNLKSITDSTSVIIKTTKGNIILELYLNDAPETVLNFVQLANDDFYDGMPFHRVVPNFVIQTGCPRGDGYGSKNYTIRTEIGDQFYDSAGYIGMASAGLNTECTQWFITQSATPHLDSRYTIFGKVVQGLDVVDKVIVGDEIIDILITKDRYFQ